MPYLIKIQFYCETRNWNILIALQGHTQRIYIWYKSRYPKACALVLQECLNLFKIYIKGIQVCYASCISQT